MIRSVPASHLSIVVKQCRAGRQQPTRTAVLCRALLCLCAALPLFVPARQARGDGGIVRVSRRAGPYFVTVFTTPTPLRAGRADVSVMVQIGATGRVVTDHRTTVLLTKPGDSGPAKSYRATRAQATNKLLRAAIIEFPSPGTWTVEVAVQGTSGPSRVAFNADVLPAPPQWFELLPWIVWPLLPIGLFALREIAVGANASERARRRRPGA
jgi:hypothetical protein